jgi:hypothetical protein
MRPESGHSFPYNAMVMNMWSFTSTSSTRLLRSDAQTQLQCFFFFFLRNPVESKGYSSKVKFTYTKFTDYGLYGRGSISDHLVLLDLITIINIW